MPDVLEYQEDDRPPKADETLTDDPAEQGKNGSEDVPAELPLSDEEITRHSER